MSFFDDVRKARAVLTSTESVATLTYMEDFFHDGENWTQHTYHAANGTKCLVAAAEYVRLSPVDDAKYWLRQAINELEPGSTIEAFNDTRNSYEEIEAVIRRAKQLARQAQLPARRPVAAVKALPAPAVAEILPPAPAPVRAIEPQPPVIDVTPVKRSREYRPGVVASVFAGLLSD